MSVWLAAAIGVLAALAASGTHAADDFSAAERAVFLANHLAGTRPPATLHYRYTQRGSLEPGFVDDVRLRLAARPDGSCCTAAGEFLSGPRRAALPEVEAAEGNPVILYFLERDIREMERLTRGKPNYFRKRIRLAMYQGATVRELQLPYQGRTVAAQQIVLTPYLDDPMRARFERYAGKQYVFTFSSAVPGGVYAVQSRIPDSADAAHAPPLIAEDLVADGATAPPPVVR